MITVFGLWHLGCVTAACCARHFPTIGLDSDIKIISQLEKAKAPLFEPGLDKLIQEGLSTGNLQFTIDPSQALADTKILWVTYDTPVDEKDNADVEFVINEVKKILPHLKPESIVLVSSQLPVGSVKRLEREYKSSKIHFVSCPENLRLGNAIENFTNSDRIIAGIRSKKVKQILHSVLEKFTSNIIWMSVENAEMTKHAINSFLAMSVAFANELAVLCESVGADAREVAKGLKTEKRIGPKAYVMPGGAFSGGTLARDIKYLTKLGQNLQKNLSLIPSISKSNEFHKSWPLHRLIEIVGSLHSRKVAILGLTYKAGTSTLRRSGALDLAKEIIRQGGTVLAYDPSIKNIEGNSEDIILVSSAEAAVQGADATLILTEWPEFKDLNWDHLISLMDQKIIIDPNRFCHEAIPLFVSELQYISVGVS